MLKILCSTIQLRDRLWNLKCGSIKVRSKCTDPGWASSMCGKLSHLVNTWSVWRNRLCGVLSLKFKLLHTTMCLYFLTKRHQQESYHWHWYTPRNSAVPTVHPISKCSCYHFFQRSVFLISRCLSWEQWRQNDKLLKRQFPSCSIFFTFLPVQLTMCAMSSALWTWASWSG